MTASTSLSEKSRILEDFEWLAYPLLKGDKECLTRRQENSRVRLVACQFVELAKEVIDMLGWNLIEPVEDVQTRCWRALYIRGSQNLLDACPRISAERSPPCDLS